MTSVPDRWDVLKEAIRSDLARLHGVAGDAGVHQGRALTSVLAKMEALEPGGAWYADPRPQPPTFGFSSGGDQDPLELVIRADGSRLTIWDLLPGTDPPAYRARGTYEWVEVNDGN